MKQTELYELQGQIFADTALRDGPVAHIASWLLDQRNLEAAWHRVRSSEGAYTPGVDGVVCKDVEANRSRWLRRLADHLRQGRYKPSPVRIAHIAKRGSGNGKRTLGVLTVEDRVVHAAVKQVLEPIVEPTFHSCSHGFRPGRSVATALRAAIEHLDREGTSERYRYGGGLDVADCFPSLDHDLLVAAVSAHVADPWFLQILRRMLTGMGHRRRRRFRVCRCGVVQGSPLSPLLCNILLDAVDAAMASWPPYRKGEVRFLRYADDIILLARDRKLARKAVGFVTGTLKRFRLSLKHCKSVVRPLSSGLDWLGVRLQPRPAGWLPDPSFGFVIPAWRFGDMIDRVRKLTRPPDAESDVDVAARIQALNRRLRGWREVYQSADNAPHVFKALDARVYSDVRGLLVAATGRQRSALAHDFGVELQRGFKTWEVDGERVLVLSSLPPRCPDRAIRAPIWQRPQPKDSPLLHLDPASDRILQPAQLERGVS